MTHTAVAILYMSVAIVAWFCVVTGYKPKRWTVRLQRGEDLVVHAGDTIEVPMADSARTMKVVEMPERGQAVCVDLQDMRYHHGMMALVAIAWPLGLPILVLATVLHFIGRDGRLWVQPRSSSECKAVHAQHAAPFMG